MKQIQWFPGHMQKAKREITEKLKFIDIVYELVDARVPFSSMNPEVPKLIGNKPRLILMNKASLADKKESSRWREYFKSQGVMAIEIDALSGDNVSKILTTTKEILKEKILKNQSKGLRQTRIRAMILGIPNVGKSTLINRIAKRSATKVGDLPGVTKTQQWITISDDLELMDTPGILWPKFEDEKVAFNLALSGAIKDDILPIDDVAIYGLKFLDKYYHDRLVERYGIEEFDFDNVISIFDTIGRKRGCLKKGQEIDYDKVSKLILLDIRGKELGAITIDRKDEFI